MEKNLQILATDLLSLFRHTKANLILIIVFIAGYCYSFFSSGGLSQFFIYGITTVVLTSLIELLNKGITLNLFISFPERIEKFLGYLFLKFFTLSFITGLIAYGIYSVFSEINFILFSIFIICFSYSIVVYYIIFLILIFKKLQPEFIEIALCILFVLFIQAVVFLLYYLISYFFVIPIVFIILFIHFIWIPAISDLVSKVSYQILENENDSVKN